jgi:hypothetical protein
MNLLFGDKVCVKTITEVSRLLGHSDCAITLRVYSHFVPRKTTTMQDLASSILS